jgi:hypothetical protein
MTIYQDKLKEMIDAVDGDVSNITSNISQIDVIITELQEQIDAITNAVTNEDSTALLDYLTDVKLPVWVGTNPTAYLVIDSTYGDIGYGNDLKGWRIEEPAALPPFPLPPPVPPDPPVVLYEYGGAGWGPGDVLIIGWVSDWDFGNDYLTRPLTSGASYGLIPYQTNLNSAKTMLQANSTKLTDSKIIFAKYD